MGHRPSDHGGTLSQKFREALDSLANHDTVGLLRVEKLITKQLTVFTKYIRDFYVLGQKQEIGDSQWS